MSLFAYYALHTFKNQIKKLFKTWVMVFLAVCLVIGIGLGVLMTFLGGAGDTGEPPGGTVEEPSFFEKRGIEKSEAIELAAGAAALLLFTVYALNADKNGSRIFLPADVNLLFPSPLKPQSVLMFRLATQLGIGVFGSVYVAFQVPNLIYNLGLGTWAAVAMMAAWVLSVMAGVLLQLALYTVSATYPAVKRNLRRGIYLALALTAASFVIFASRGGDGWLLSAVRFFNAPGTRYIPFWGWIKGMCGFAAEGNAAGALLLLLAVILGGAALVFLIWHIRADFYEDAMARSEETARLLTAQSEKSTGVVIKRKKDRSERLLRDGLDRGFGADVYFWKAIYNHRRFAHLGFLTKTAETYLLASLVVGCVCRFVARAGSFLPVALTLAAFVFFRSLGNPLEQDTGMDWFVTVPEPALAKLFWSLAGGTVNCLLDLLPAVILGAVLVGAGPLEVILWVPVMASVDFYATTVGTFIALSVPVSAGKSLKQTVQVMFVYFGLVPDMLIAIFGIARGVVGLAMLMVSAVDFGLGALFLALSPRFVEPGDRYDGKDGSDGGALKMAKRQFSRLGAALLTFLVSAAVFQIVAGVIVALALDDPSQAPGWLNWAVTFAPMYLLAAPLGLLVMRKAPARERERHAMGVGRFLKFAAISVFIMYAGNLLGSLILAALEAVIGTSAENPLLNYAFDDNVVIRALVMAVLAPMVEEYIFRKQLIDRMNAYGEKLAVFTSALMFGFFHGNLSQFFYAFALGLVFGYVYLKTGRLRYSTALHMTVNFMGSVVAPEVLESVDLAMLESIDLSDPAAIAELGTSLLPVLAYGLVMLALVVTGLVLFCVNFRKISFDPAPMEIERGERFKTVFLNPGMILFTVLCLASVVLTFVI